LELGFTGFSADQSNTLTNGDIAGGPSVKLLNRSSREYHPGKNWQERIVVHPRPALEDGMRTFGEKVI
jgi:hypothetical protein